MAKNKTTPNHGSVADFLASVENDTRRDDAETLLAEMAEITGLEPVMWGASLIGFDTYHYKYESGREGDMFRIGLSPRKAKLVLYIVPGFQEYGDYLEKLGKHKTSVSCLYINKLADVDMSVLRDLMKKSYADMNAKYPK